MVENKINSGQYIKVGKPDFFQVYIELVSVLKKYGKENFIKGFFYFADSSIPEEKLNKLYSKFIKGDFCTILDPWFFERYKELAISHEVKRTDYKIYTVKKGKELEKEDAPHLNDAYSAYRDIKMIDNKYLSKNFIKGLFLFDFRNFDEKILDSVLDEAIKNNIFFLNRKISLIN